MISYTQLNGSDKLKTDQRTVGEDKSMSLKQESKIEDQPHWSVWYAITKNKHTCQS